jgi:hypothetical protein
MFAAAGVAYRLPTSSRAAAPPSSIFFIHDISFHNKKKLVIKLFYIK